jgi:hypothetical protein
MKALSAVLTLILIFAGCTIFGEDDNGKVTPLYSGEKYFPLKIGSAWTYRHTDMDSLGNQQIFNFTNSVIGTVSRTNKTYTIIFDSVKGDSLLARLDGNVLYVLRQVGASQGNVLSEVPFIDFDVKVGQSWVIYSQTYSIQGFTISQDIRGNFIDVETVFGTFTDCLRYRITDTTSITSSTSTSSTTTLEDIWLAPNAGKVKLTNEYRENNILRKSFLEEIISYTIPK